MSKRFSSFGLPLLAAAGLAVAAGFATLQSEDKLDAVGVSKMVQGMGYELKTLNTEVGKEKYEFTISKGGLDIPIAAEVSPSKNYIWFTIFFGEAPVAAQANGAKMHALLNWNFKVQPAQFYITDKGNLMMAYAIDNRNVTPALMRRVIDKIVDDAVRSKDAWANGGK
jgi:hypothetical protein